MLVENFRWKCKYNSVLRRKERVVRSRDSRKSGYFLFIPQISKRSGATAFDCQIRLENSFQGGFSDYVLLFDLIAARYWLPGTSRF